MFNKILLTLLSINCSLLTVTAQWVEVTNGMAGYVNVLSLAKSGNNLFAGTGYESYTVYLSTNNGTSWTPTSLNNVTVSSLAATGNYIFAGCSYPSFGLLLSTNNGTTWTVSLSQYISSLAVNGNNIFAGIYSPGPPYNGSVYLSTNNGTSWIQTSLNNVIGMSALAVNGNNVFAGTWNGVYKSTDNGTSWTQTSLNNRLVGALAVNGNYVFAGTDNNGVYKSTDNGTTWTQYPLNNQDVWALAISGNNIFAGIYDYGVYVSNDNGATWILRNEGFTEYIEVVALCILNNYIFAGGFPSLFRRPLDELTGIKPISNEVPQAFSLSQNYPNPFNPKTKIKFDIPNSSPLPGGVSEGRGGFVRLLIYDILGREVAALVNEQLQQGTYEIEWDGTNYPSGVYYYRLIAGDYSDTKKMVLVK